MAEEEWRCPTAHPHVTRAFHPLLSSLPLFFSALRSFALNGHSDAAERSLPPTHTHTHTCAPAAGLLGFFILPTSLPRVLSVSPSPSSGAPVTPRPRHSPLRQLAKPSAYIKPSPRRKGQTRQPQSTAAHSPLCHFSRDFRRCALRSSARCTAGESTTRPTLFSPTRCAGGGRAAVRQGARRVGRGGAIPPRLQGRDALDPSAPHPLTPLTLMLPAGASLSGTRGSWTRSSPACARRRRSSPSSFSLTRATRLALSLTPLRAVRRRGVLRGALVKVVYFFLVPRQCSFISPLLSRVHPALIHRVPGARARAFSEEGTVENGTDASDV